MLRTINRTDFLFSTKILKSELSPHRRQMFRKSIISQNKGGLTDR